MLIKLLPSLLQSRIRPQSLSSTVAFRVQSELLHLVNFAGDDVELFLERLAKDQLCWVVQSTCCGEHAAARSTGPLLQVAALWFNTAQRRHHSLNVP